jgi:hypothetical protein
MGRVHQTGILCTIVFIAVVSAASCNSTVPDTQTMKSENTMQTWTVAKVIDDPQNRYLKVMFLESARIYKLMRDNADYDRSSRLLEKAGKDNASVKVLFTEPHGDIIKNVE